MLLKNTFDLYLLEEAMLNAVMKMEFDGHLYEGYLPKDELENSYVHGNCVFYADVRHIFLECIKGANTPESFKFVFKAPKELEEMIAKKANESSDSIGGLYMNVTFKDGIINIVSGLTKKGFSLDKTIDGVWDDYVQRFLDKSGFDWV
jgi:hypothetical protein